MHVSDVKAGLDWYQRAFPESKAIYFEEFDFVALEVNGFLLEIVPADDKVGAGKQGTVLYWSRDVSSSGSLW